MSRQQSSQSSTAQIVEPGRIPDPPAIWYPLGSVPLASTSMSSERPSSSQDGDAVEERRPRGPSCPMGPWGPDGGKLHIIMNKMGQPIMDAHSVLATHLGVLARDGLLAPLHYYDWRYIPEHCKARIWNEIKGNTNADESMKSFLMKFVPKKWRDWKHDAKQKGYNKYSTDRDRLAHRPSRVHEDQWRCLVYYWGSREAHDLSDKNFQIRKKQILVHTTGRTPHCVIKQREKKKRKASPSRIEMFITTHTKDGKPINVAVGEIMEKLLELETTREESTTTSIANDDQIFTEVMGFEREGRIRGCGMGPTPSQVFGGKQTTSQATPCGQCGEELRYLKDRMKLMEAALSAMGITLPVPQDQANMDTIMISQELTKTRMMQALREELASANRRIEEERVAHNVTKMAFVEREVELEHRAVEASNALVRIQASSKKKRTRLRSGTVTKVCRDNP